MLSTSKTKNIVGLDIEAGSVAAMEVRANGRVEVVGHGVAPLAPGVFREGEVADVEALGTALKGLFSEHKLSKNVRLGIGNQRVVVRTLSLPRIEKADELEAAIRFQAHDQIPMPLDQAVLDWEVVGHGTGASGEPRVEVVVVAARRDMVAALIEALSKAGLRPMGIDLSAFGMIRALAGQEHARIDGGAGVAPGSYEDRLGAPAGSPEDGLGAGEQPSPAKLYCNLGDVINLAVAQGPTCLFTRISPFGVEGIAQRLAERRQLTLEHARQWLVHVGLDRPLEQIDGDRDVLSATRESLAEGAAKLADELRLSLEYYGAQEGAVAVEGIVACGPGTTIPGMVEWLQRNIGHAFSVARPPALAHLDDAAAARLTLPFGLALEE